MLTKNQEAMVKKLETQKVKWTSWVVVLSSSSTPETKG